jgi:uncharacterized protein (UPF0218 family)
MPFGVLITGSFNETMVKLEIELKEEKPVKIISVGDTVSSSLHKHNIIPQLSITDNLSLRKKVKPEVFPGKSIVRVVNPPGTITKQAVAAVKEALAGDKFVQIVVQGEEDLLVLIGVLYAPLQSLVVYGQPHEGVVLVKVTPEKKIEVKKILEAMKTLTRVK